ncbi:MAG TPA: isochorismate synthase [Candidatus Polarisedimenticolia bacterium]|nr:isochorismate synthase [Candidatus Polarisedimenticolia bacterium]
MAILSKKPESLSSESVLIQGKSPWECLLELRHEIQGQPVAVWESPEGLELAGIGVAARIETSGPERFEEARERLGAILGQRSAFLLGGFSFREQGASRGWPGFPDLSFTLPQRLFWREKGRATCETRWRGPAPAPPSTASPSPEDTAAWDKPAWTDAVRRTLERIRAGEISKAVLARSITVPLHAPGSPLDILANLRATYPSCCRFLLDDGRGNAFLGASPERLVSVDAKTFLADAVAGTIRCGPEDDPKAIERKLVQSEKDQREHEVVLRHILEALTPLSTQIRSMPPRVLRLPHLLHLRTAVVGWTPRRHVLEFVSRLHPTPAVAGWPRAEALEWIGGAEPVDRGWYAGGVGWLNESGDGDFAVGIRSVAIQGDRARLFAGAGIVEGSDPEQEWSETELKMKGMLDAIARD